MTDFKRPMRALSGLLLIALPLAGTADTFNNAIALFEFAEAQFPELASPPNPETQEIQGFYVRYYENSKIYLGVQGDNIWAVGGSLGEQVKLYGKLRDYLELQNTDLSDALLSNRRPYCTFYADNTFSSVRDIQRNLLFTGDVSITVEGDAVEEGECVITANGIPNHDFNDADASFATDVSEVSYVLRIPVNPTFADEPTSISLNTDNGILLNGVKIDLLAAACYNVGDERIGCNNMDQPWRLDPMSPLNRFGTDSHNAHTQPNGAYHYHGNPKALFQQENTSQESPVVGFAADGFPIYGPFIDDHGIIRRVTSSYQLRAGSRPSGTGDPGGSYDGTYRDDYEYVANSGDLDECNGMMWNGAYGYYIIDAFPWVLNCYRGTPHVSFNKSAGGPGGGPPPNGL